jgi:hypothetical protein
MITLDRTRLTDSLTLLFLPKCAIISSTRMFPQEIALEPPSWRQGYCFARSKPIVALFLSRFSRLLKDVNSGDEEVCDSWKS